MNPILLSDSYKLSHAKQYPPGTTKVYSYFESRGGRFPSTIFFGLQYILKKYLAPRPNGFYPVVTPADVQNAAQLAEQHFGNPHVFNRAGWDHLVRAHDGRFPVRIRAVKEGSCVPVSNVLMTVENTCPECAWITNFLETLLVQTWYPMTVATLSWNMKRMMRQYCEETGSHEGLLFKLHDFGYRGCSSVESASLGGASHLTQFLGTDTLGALALAEVYYGEACAGYSIPASEHSTITSWGKEHEVEAFQNMLTSYPTGLVACVSDSYDIFHACQELWGTQLKDQILKREGTLVIRPDSGNPADTIMKCLDILGAKFGTTLNSKGYKVLDPHVRLIQGDGVNFNSTAAILQRMASAGWSIDNIAFGMGGALLQQLDRDTQKCAFKCSYTEVNGVGRDVWKDPITDTGKRSKRGKLALVKNNAGHYQTVSDDPSVVENELQLVFENGVLYNETTFAEVRARSQEALYEAGYPSVERTQAFTGTN